MIFRQFFHHESSTYTYLVADHESKQAAFIDPVKDQLDTYLTILKELGLELSYALDTHVHADHITCLGDLRQETNCITIMGRGSEASCVSQFVENHEQIELGELTIEAITTPGHTAESFSYRVGQCLFTGDTLLIRGCGRTDFQNGDPYVLYKSIQALLTYPEHYSVYPAHDYKGWTSSTIGEEKQWNPRLQVSSAKEFADIMNNLNLPDPKKMDTAIPANLLCGRPL